MVLLAAVCMYKYTSTRLYHIKLCKAYKLCYVCVISFYVIFPHMGNEANLFVNS